MRLCDDFFIYKHALCVDWDKIGYIGVGGGDSNLVPGVILYSGCLVVLQNVGDGGLIKTVDPLVPISQLHIASVGVGRYGVLDVNNRQCKQERLRVYMYIYKIGHFLLLVYYKHSRLTTQECFENTTM